MAPSKIVQERKTFNTEVGRRVAGLRKQRGLTQLQLAEAASAPQSTISSIESGSRGATPQQRGRIAGALGVPLAALDPMQVPADRFAEVAAAGPVLEPPAQSTGYIFWSGTSFSTPLVSGLAALVLEIGRGGLSPQQVEDILKCGAVKTADPNLGAGVINVPATLACCEKLRDEREPKPGPDPQAAS